MMRHRSHAFGALAALVCGCMPSTDLDAHARGDGQTPAAVAPDLGSMQAPGDGAASAGAAGSTGGGESLGPVALDPAPAGGSGPAGPISSTTDGAPDAGSTPSDLLADAAALPSEPQPPLVS